MASSLQRPRSRYTKGGTTDQFANRLGWWERDVMPFREDDRIITITGRYVNRPDLIAERWLGDIEYEWLVLLYNTILDPVVELAEGSVIRLPAVTRLT